MSLLADTNLTLLIRADASVRIGSGHVMRCLALAQGWQSFGGRVVFAQAESTPSLEMRLRVEGIQITRLDNISPGSDEDAIQTIQQCQVCEAQWVVADGYGFNAAWQKRVKAAGYRLLLFDDYGHADYYEADLILNQNLHAREALYSRREPYTRLLLCTGYAQLRSEFLVWREWQREVPAVAHKIIVTLGGSDPDNVTDKIIQAVGCLPDLEAVVVAGGSNPKIESLRNSVSQTPFHLAVDAQNMPELMAWADVAVSSGGTTSLELAFMGLPSLLLVLADNQREVVNALDAVTVARRTTVDSLAADLAVLLGDANRRCAMSRFGRQLVDGRGVERVTHEILKPSPPRRSLSQNRGECRDRLKTGRQTRFARKVRIPAALVLRRADAHDCRLLWEWANDPHVRATSFHREPIAWEQHVAWFKHKMQSQDSLIFIGLIDSQPCGQIRFDLDPNGEAEVGVSIAPERRGRGLGSALIQRAAAEAFSTAPVCIIHAHVMVANQVSVLAFEKAGFRRSETAVYKGSEALHLILKKSND